MLKSRALLVLVGFYLIFRASHMWGGSGFSYSVLFFDVGQGDSVLIRDATTTILIDGGEHYTLDRYLDNLWWRSKCRINVIFPTHIDTDHIGGLVRLLRHCEIDEVRFNDVSCASQTCDDFTHLLSNITVKNVHLGDRLNYGNIEIKILWPRESLHNENSNVDPNDSSTVMLVRYSDFDMLLTGDAPAEVLAQLDTRELLTFINGDLEVYKASHHGALNGFSSALLYALSPEYCVVSVGTDNRYGHPHPETLAAFSAVGCKVLRTDQLGTLEFRF
jgi:competence protein ComEC